MCPGGTTIHPWRSPATSRCAGTNQGSPCRHGCACRCGTRNWRDTCGIESPESSAEGDLVRVGACGALGNEADVADGGEAGCLLDQVQAIGIEVVGVSERDLVGSPRARGQSVNQRPHHLRQQRLGSIWRSGDDERLGPAELVDEGGRATGRCKRQRALPDDDLARLRQTDRNRTVVLPRRSRIGRTHRSGPGLDREAHR